MQNLADFWKQNKKRIGEALSRGMDELAETLRTGAENFNLVQKAFGETIQWTTKEDVLQILFCRVLDPRDLDRIIEVFELAKNNQPVLVAVLVHQWTDGEGNWDIFAITPRLALAHADRIWGSRKRINMESPIMREEIYNLFDCEREFPPPGNSEWAKLLDGPSEKVFDQLDKLAKSHDCTQEVEGLVAHWKNSDEKLEAMFFVEPNPEDLNAFIEIYRKIRKTQCPVSFVFVKSDKPGCYDIFRLSALSYMEHHTQAKIWARKKVRFEKTGRTPKKMLDNLLWEPRWSSHVGCIKGCLKSLDVEVSSAWLYGATGHAFVLNIKGDLCPSGPTDWNTDRFLELGRNIGYDVDKIDVYCPNQDDDLSQAQKEAWNFVKSKIDRGIPCYGWELDIPEYYVIYGYDSEGYYISGPGCDKGKGPSPKDNLGRSEIGVVFIGGINVVEPADDKKAVHDSLSSALDLGHNRIEWTDGFGGLEGYKTWIHSMETGEAGLFGLAFNTAVWAECRKFAVDFLEEARERIGGGLEPLFEKAAKKYDIVAQNLKTVSELYPFSGQLKHDSVEMDQNCKSAVSALKRAHDAEAEGLDILEEIVRSLS